MRVVRTRLSGGELASLERLILRVQENLPRGNDPETFHVEKSEIVNDLRRAVGALRVGHPIPEIEARERGKQR